MPNNDPVRTELKRLMRYANAAKVADALGVSRATAARWSRGESGDELALRGVRQLFGHMQKTPPSVRESGAAEDLLRLWTSATPPPWAVTLTNQIAAMLLENRRLLTEAMETVAEESGDETRQLVSDEVRRALDEAARKPPPQPGGADDPAPVHPGEDDQDPPTER